MNIKNTEYILPVKTLQVLRHKKSIFLISNSELSFNIRLIAVKYIICEYPVIITDELVSSFLHRKLYFKALHKANLHQLSRKLTRAHIYTNKTNIKINLKISKLSGDTG